MKKRILSWLLPMLLLCLLPVAAWAADDTLPKADSNGVITLNEDVTLNETKTITQDTTLDLNGHQLDFASSKYLKVQDKAILTIQDTSKAGNGKVTSSASTRTVYVGSNSKLILKSGMIESVSKVGINLYTNASFTMDGGTVRAGTSAVVTSNSTVDINKGIIEGGASAGNYGIKMEKGTVTIGENGGTDGDIYISGINSLNDTHILTIKSGVIGNMVGFVKSTDSLEGVYESEFNKALPASKICRLGSDGKYKVEVFTNEADAEAKIDTDLYASVYAAAARLQDGQTLTLLKAVIGDKNGALIEIKDARNVTVDLNGHNVTNTNVEKSSKAFEIRNPNGADGASVITNTAGTPVTVTATIPMRFLSQNSKNKNIVTIDDSVQLVCNSGTQGIDLGGGAVLTYSEQAVKLVGNGGFKCVRSDGTALIMSSYGAALKEDADQVVEMLNDYVSSSKLVLYTGTLDMGGHSYTYTGPGFVAYSAKSTKTLYCTLTNGSINGNHEESEGIFVEGDNKNLTLDHVKVFVAGISFGISTNGIYTGDNITMKNSSVLEVPNGIAMYFPSKNGKVLIDNSNITAHTGVQVCGGNSVLEVNNSTITANGTPIEKSGTENDGPVLDGAAVSVLSRYQGDGENTKVSLNGGTYESKETEAVKAYRFQKVSDNWVTNDQTNLTNKIDSIAISDGNFIGGGVDKAPFDIDEAAVKDDHSVTQVTGGHFSATLDDKYLADSLTIEVQTPTKNPQAPVSYHPNIDEALEEAKNDTSSTVQPINPPAETVVVTFNINGGEGAPASVTIEENKTITLPLPTREGYTFLGWQDKAGVIYKAGDSKSITDNVTFTAVWEANSTGGGTVVKRYDVTLADTDNGSITATHKRASKNSTVSITATPDEGYVVDAVTVTEKDGDKVEVTKKDDNKYTFKMPASDVTVKATFKATQTEPEQPSGLPFTDVAKDAWYFPAVEYVFNNGLMNGTTATTFAPNVNLNRAMMAAVLYNMEGKPACDKSGLFSDVENGKWYTDAINWAASNNIVSGMPDGTYAPNQALTREQMASILYRYAEYKGIDVSARADLSTFTDGTTVSPWAQDVVQWAVAEKLMSGNGNELQPKGTASRAQVATVLMNYSENVAK